MKTGVYPAVKSSYGTWGCFIPLLHWKRIRQPSVEKAAAANNLRDRKPQRPGLWRRSCHCRWGQWQHRWPHTAAAKAALQSGDCHPPGCWDMGLKNSSHLQSHCLLYQWCHPRMCPVILRTKTQMQIYQKEGGETSIGKKETEESQEKRNDRERTVMSDKKKIRL